jgi:hypothetical protein
MVFSSRARDQADQDTEVTSKSAEVVSFASRLVDSRQQLGEPMVGASSMESKLRHLVPCNGNVRSMLALAERETLPDCGANIPPGTVERDKDVATALVVPEHAAGTVWLKICRLLRGGPTHTLKVWICRFKVSRIPDPPAGRMSLLKLIPVCWRLPVTIAHSRWALATWVLERCERGDTEEERLGKGAMSHNRIQAIGRAFEKPSSGRK